MSDYCQLPACDLGVGNLTWTGTGWANCTDSINVSGMDFPTAGQTLYALINKNCAIRGALNTVLVLLKLT